MSLSTNIFLFKEGDTNLVGSPNTVTNIPGLESSNAWVIANGYDSEYFHAFSTGAPSPNLQSLLIAVVVVWFSENTLVVADVPVGLVYPLPNVLREICWPVP